MTKKSETTKTKNCRFSRFETRRLTERTRKMILKNQLRTAKGRGEGGREKWHEQEKREKEGEQGLHGDARRWQGFDLSQAAVWGRSVNAVPAGSSNGNTPGHPRPLRSLTRSISGNDACKLHRKEGRNARSHGYGRNRLLIVSTTLRAIRMC